MENKERINHVGENLILLWSKYPHLQFNQLVNVMRERYKMYNRKYVDFSEVSDEDFIDFLKYELK